MEEPESYCPKFVPATCRPILLCKASLGKCLTSSLISSTLPRARLLPSSFATPAPPPKPARVLSRLRTEPLITEPTECIFSPKRRDEQGKNDSRRVAGRPRRSPTPGATQPVELERDLIVTSTAGILATFGNSLKRGNNKER